MWFVALQPCQGQPCDCFEHLLVITLSTWAEPLRKKNGAHNVVKRGIRTMLLLLGIPPKLIRFIGWVVGFPQLSWEYPKNLPPSPSHFWGGVACGCCIRRLWKEVPDLFRYQFWQWFLQPISFTPNFEITPLCDKKNI